jgi:hypothetical protein
MENPRQPASRYPQYLWTVYGLNPTPEVRFHPTRRWKFDYAWPERLVAVEIDGGVFSGGRHSRGYGYRADCEKINAAGLMGWRVFRFLPEQLRSGEAQTFMHGVLGS